MSNLAKSTQVKMVGSVITQMAVPIKAGAKIYAGAMVCLVTATGYAVRAGTAGTGCVQGVAQAEAGTVTVDGDTNVNLLTGIFAIPVHATHTPTIVDVGKAVYASDDQTISNTSTDGPVAGILVGFEATSGKALVMISPASNGTAPATGADGYKEIPISAAILAAGTPMAAFADSATSDPGITLANSKAMGLRWNNAATQIAVWLRFDMPADIDITQAATLEVYASKTGATSGDATTFTVTAFNNALGALHDADSDFGGATSAMTGTATAKTVQKVTLTLAAADLGAANEPVSMSIKPTNGLLGTDDVIVHGINLKYKRR